MNRLFAGTQFDRPPRCERCDELEEDCQCPPLPPVAPERIPPQKQTATLRIEKRKKGKLVSIILGLDAVNNDLPELLTLLKNKCGAGGSIQEGALEIQGKHLDRLRTELQIMGYKVKG